MAKRPSHPPCACGTDLQGQHVVDIVVFVVVQLDQGSDLGHRQQLPALRARCREPHELEPGPIGPLAQALLRPLCHARLEAAAHRGARAASLPLGLLWCVLVSLGVWCGVIGEDMHGVGGALLQPVERGQGLGVLEGPCAVRGACRHVLVQHPELGHIGQPGRCLEDQGGLAGGRRERPRHMQQKGRRAAERRPRCAARIPMAQSRQKGQK
jgi:hypothetical protein